LILLRPSGGKWIELLLVLPGTVFLGSALPFGIAYLIFLIGLGLIGTTQPVEAKLHSIAPLVPLFLTMQDIAKTVG
jgi:hypothetical protein